MTTVWMLVIMSIVHGGIVPTYGPSFSTHGACDAEVAWLKERRLGDRYWCREMSMHRKEDDESYIPETLHDH